MHLHLSLLLLPFSHLASSMLLGWVESPGYPHGYLPHASLNWSRCARKGHIIAVSLIHLDLEDSHNCENDAVKVGLSTKERPPNPSLWSSFTHILWLQVLSDGSPIAILCGQKGFAELQSSVNPVLRSSPGGCLTILFVSDYSNTKRHSGFRGFYTEQGETRRNEDSKRCLLRPLDYISTTQDR